jgi:hypothetical protein
MIGKVNGGLFRCRERRTTTPMAALQACQGGAERSGSAETAEAAEALDSLPGRAPGACQEGREQAFEAAGPSWPTLNAGFSQRATNPKHSPDRPMPGP